MKTFLLTFLGLATGAFSLSAQTGVYVPELAAFDTAMINLLNDYDVPGGQLAITYEGRLVYNRGFGLAEVPNQDSVTPQHVFRIASVSKTITGVACVKLHEEGMLDLDAKVFGPSGILNDAQYQNMLDPRDTLITVRMLLHHSGGWNSSIAGDPMFNAYNIATVMGVPSPPSEEVTIQYILAHKMLNFTPGTQYAYSNFGYCVLGRVIEKVSGMSYVDYVQSKIFNPLNIHDTQLGFNLEENKLTHEVSYYDYPGAGTANSIYDNSTQVSWPYGGFNLEFMDAHGGWVSSAESLVKFVCGIDQFSSRPDILDNASLDTLTQPSPNNPNYALGIQVNQNGNWWHNGSLPGTTSEIVRNGNGKLNWAILLNTRDQAGNINTATDLLVWNVLPSISSWPSHDLFDTTTNIQEASTLAPISVFPNPANEKLSVTLRNDKGLGLHIRLFNSVGQLVHRQYAGIGVKTTSIDVSKLATGMYLMEVLTDDHQQYREKVIIAR